ncbi:MAG: hypothetical protein ACE5OR_07720 [bacterium]
MKKLSEAGQPSEVTREDFQSLHELAKKEGLTDSIKHKIWQACATFEGPRQ